MYLFLFLSKPASADIATEWDWIGLYPTDIDYNACSWTDPSNKTYSSPGCIYYINANSNPVGSLLNPADPVHPGQVYVKDINSDWISGQIQANVPAQAGAYEFRMFVNDRINAWPYNTPGFYYAAVGQTFWSTIKKLGTITVLNATCYLFPTVAVQVSWGPFVGVGRIEIYRNGAFLTSKTNINGAINTYTDSSGLVLDGTYNYYIRAYAKNGSGSYDTTNTVSVTADACTPSDISLTVQEKTPGQSLPFAGVTGTSGRLSTESGSDWLNPLKIILDATAQGGATVSKYYVAFYDNTLSFTPPDPDDMDDIKPILNADPRNGFMILYTKNMDRCGPGMEYCVWVGGGWDNLNPNKTIYFAGNQILEVTKASASMPPNSWAAYFKKDFSSKSFKTAVQVIDSLNRKIFVEDCTTASSDCPLIQ